VFIEFSGAGQIDHTEAGAMGIDIDIRLVFQHLLNGDKSLILQNALQEDLMQIQLGGTGAASDLDPACTGGSWRQDVHRDTYLSRHLIPKCHRQRMLNSSIHKEIFSPSMRSKDIGQGG